MRTIKDTEGRSWNIVVDANTAKRLRQRGVDLMEIVEENNTLFHRLGSDHLLLIDTLYLVCKPQADERSVTEEQFLKAIAGDAIDDATAAVLEEIVDFFPSRRRQILRAVLEKTRIVDEKAAALATARMKDPRIDAAIEKAMRDHAARIDSEIDRLAGNSSGDSPASSASTPAPSPSAS